MTSPVRRGIALLLVLILVAAGAVLVVSAGFSSQTSAHVADAYGQAEQLRAGVAAGLAMASFALLDDLETNDFDSLEDTWAQGIDDLALGDVRVRVRIEDEYAKVFLGPFSESGLEFPWLSKRSEPDKRPVGPRPNMREPRREEAPPVRWEWFLALGKQEVLEIDDQMDDDGLRAAFDEQNERLHDLLHYVTFWTDGRLNANTAEPEVLSAALSDLGSSLADRLHSKVKRSPLEDDEELREATGLAGSRFEQAGERLRTSSDTFSVHVEARIGEVERRALYIVRRQEDRVAVLCRVY